MEKKRLIERCGVILMHAVVSFYILLYSGKALGGIVKNAMASTGDEGLAFAGVYLKFIGIWAVVFLYWLIIKYHRPMFRILGPEAKGNRLKTALPLGLILGLGMNLAVALVALAMGDIRLVFNRLDPLYVLLFIVCVGIQSGAEELLCRGHLYQQLRKSFPKAPWVAIVGNALIFSLIHIWNSGVSMLALLIILLTGILYSMVVYYFDSFWACVIAHAGWNFCQSILLGLPNSGITSMYSVFKLEEAKDGFAFHVNFGIESTVAALILVGIACVAVFLIGRKRKQKPLDLWSRTCGERKSPEGSEL